MNAPSGEQVEIAFGDQSAVIVEVGGGLRSYSCGEFPLLDGYAVDEMCTSGRGQVLAPWPNRIEDGQYEFDGLQHKLPLDEPDRRNAIHGLVRWASWRVSDPQPDRVAMEHTIHPQPGYPFSLGLRIEYQLTADGLSARLTATNVGKARCPYGAGAHPYLRLGDRKIDTLGLRAPARTVLHSSERGIPAHSNPVDGTEYDFRRLRTIGQTVLDHALTDLERDADGIARIYLSDPERRNGLTIWADRSYGYIMLFSGDPLPDVDRRSIAVEPMTCPPNAFRSGESVVVLEPGESFASRWGIEPGVRSLPDCASGDPAVGGTSW